MDKRNLHHYLTQVRRIKVRYLGIAFLTSLLVCSLALRSNNLEMVKLRDAVFAADKNNGDVQTALAKLQAYVVRHMNAGLSSGTNPVYPPIQLQYTYDRLVAKEQARVDAANSSVYNKAQHHCETLNSVDFSGRNRVPCIQQYVQDHGAKMQSIPSSLYQFDFVAAKWSPDLAGWSVISTSMLALLFLVRLLLEWWLRKASR